MSEQQADVIIVGGGAAGVSAAWPVVDAGLRVVMLDQGNRASPPPRPEETFSAIRRGDGDQWRYFVGEDFSAFRGAADETPKLKVPGNRPVLEGFEAAYNISADGLKPTGSLARGGMTRIWGAGAYGFDDGDLTGFPIDRGDLLPSYRAVAERMGISGADDDDLSPFIGDDFPLQPPLPLHDTAAGLLSRYGERKTRATGRGIVLGRARNAVLSEPLAGRAACTLDNMCLWGCDKDSIYSAEMEIPHLERHENFIYSGGAFVSGIIRDDGVYRVSTRDRNRPEDVAAAGNFSAPVVILAAGTIGSTCLALSHLGIYGKDIPLICHPSFAMAFVWPGRIGAQAADKGFALGQLAYAVRDDAGSDDYAFGVIFAAEGLLASDLALHMPLTRPGAIGLTRYMMPAMLVANGYVSGTHGDCSLRLEKHGEGDRLLMRGGYKDTFVPKMNDVTMRLSKFFRSLGIYLLPGSAKPGRLGSDGHFAGTLPMTRAMTADAIGTTVRGEVIGAPNLFVADGAALPGLPPKHPTFTIMANAERTGRHVAGLLK